MTLPGDVLPVSTVDVVVLGGGPVGENVADRARRGGLTVTVVEPELLGGECSFWACVPSKTLLRPGAALAAARAVPGVLPADRQRVDPAAVLARRNAMVSDWDDAGDERWLADAGIGLVRGRGLLVGERLVEVVPAEAEFGGEGLPRRLRARHAVVLATGSVPVLPDIPGLAEAAPWTSREATGVDDVPASLAIIGGGVVAAEMATAFADLGAEVTVLSRGPLLGRTEPWAGRAVVASLEAMGVAVRVGAEPVAVRVEADGTRSVELRAGESVRAAQVLVAAGRIPRSQDLGLDVVGLTPGKPVATDDAMQVLGVDGGWLYAAGDVTGRAALTHQGKYEGRVAGDVVAARFGSRAADGAGPGGVGADGTGGGSGRGPWDGSAEVPAVGAAPKPWSRYAASADAHAAPQVVFTRPQVASVGYTEAAARAAGHEVRAVQADLGAVSGGYLHGDGYEGTAQLVVDTARQVVLGATFVGPDAAEMLHAATIAVVGEVPLHRLWHAVPAYPTVSEGWLRLLEAYGL